MGFNGEQLFFHATCQVLIEPTWSNAQVGSYVSLYVCLSACLSVCEFTKIHWKKGNISGQ